MSELHVMNKSLIGAFVAGAMVAGGGAQAEVYDAASQFSITQNPSTVWGYYYSYTMPMTLAQQDVDGVSGLDSWSNGLPLPDSSYIVRNNTGADVWQGAGPGSTILFTTNALNLDPQSLSAQVQFTAPRSGQYWIQGSFTGHDQYINVPTHPVNILDDGVVVYSNTISAFGQTDSFAFAETLAKGDTIVFSVGTGDTGCSYCYLSTGLVADLTVPEPATWVSMLVGFATLGYAGYRRNCRTNVASV